MSFFISVGRRTVLLAVTLLTGSAAWAQSGFQAGYIVRPQGDTVRGQVENRRAEANAQLCRFRATESAAVEEFAPGALRAYGVAEKAYESQPVTSATSGTPNREPAYDRPAAENTNATTSPVFLEVTARGPVTLYYVAAAGGERFFVRGSGPLRELTEEKRLLEAPDGTRRELVIPRFRGVLTEEFTQCPAEQLNVSTTTLKYSSLTERVRRYNACVTGKTAQEVTRGGRTSWGIVAGGIVTQQLTLGTGDGSSPLNDKLTGDGLPVIVGVSLGLTPTRINERITYQIIAFLTLNHSFGHQGARFAQYENLPIGVRPGVGRSELKYSTLDIGIVPRYRFGAHRVRPYLEAGGTLFYLLGVTRNYTEYRYDNANTPIKLDDRSGELLEGGTRKIGYTFLGGGGVEYGRIALGVRYQLGYKISEYISGSLTRCVSVVAGFRLK